MTSRKPQSKNEEDTWARFDAEWRDPAQVVSQWEGAGEIDPGLLKSKTEGDWWNIIASRGITLLVTREYEHLIVALGAGSSGPSVSYLPLPHPSGLAVDRRRRVVHVASTRNPNQIVDLKPLTAAKEDLDRPLVPVNSQFFPGRLYLHDLALIGGELFGTAVGENAIVRFPGPGQYERAWWPRVIENRRSARFDKNYLQLNSIAAGPNVSESFFSASTDQISVRRPGHQNFAVDKRGVIFSGATREPVVRGLTRPHSARIYRKRLWVDNSGYGELCVVNGSTFDTVARLPGWTRGLCFHDGIAFVGTSRIIPRFSQYAPGLDVSNSKCGIYAVNTRTGKVLGSLTWPAGNQIFAVECVESSFASGLPFVTGSSERRLASARKLFYNFQTET
jgi:uncharacterized protein (TIGR03032 family)